MSPDLVNVTEDRVVNPANTLNKYVYGGNSQAATLFYLQSLWRWVRAGSSWRLLAKNRIFTNNPDFLGRW
jgi:hypothetical protein